MQIPDKYKNSIEDITEFLMAIHEERDNSNLVNCLLKKIDELIEKIDETTALEKLKVLRNKILLLKKNLDICTDEFLEESLYLLTYLKK